MPSPCHVQCSPIKQSHLKATYATDGLLDAAVSRPAEMAVEILHLHKAMTYERNKIGAFWKLMDTGQTKDLKLCRTSTYTLLTLPYHRTLYYRGWINS